VRKRVERLYNQQGDKNSNKKRRILDLPLLLHTSRLHKKGFRTDGDVVCNGASNPHDPRLIGDYYSPSTSELMKASTSIDAASTAFPVMNTRLRSESHQQMPLLQEMRGAPQRNEHLIASGMRTSGEKYRNYPDLNYPDLRGSNRTL
jgi:hypothetical protein